MSPINLRQTLERYSTTLLTLEEARPQPSAEQILAVLKARDAINVALTDKTQDAVDGLIAVIQLDNRLKQQTARIAQTVPLVDWRASFQPPAGAWWWFIEAPASRWARFDWLWSALAVVVLTISLSLLLDTSTRFLGDGPDTWATFAVVGQSILALLAAGGTLTTLGRELVDRIFRAVHVPTHWRQALRLVLAALLLSALLVLRSFLPEIAVLYNDRGLASFYNGQYTSAEFDFHRALKLSPEYVIPHYNLGLLYEDLHDYEQAKTEYRLAVAGKFNAAYNNLARLYILEENYNGAVPLLLVALDLAQDKEVLYDLHKNLGWARLEQTRLAEAEVELQAAIDLTDNKAPAHCLLAQVLESQQKDKEALVEWENCLKYADPRRPDEDTWIEMARQRLREAD